MNFRSAVHNNRTEREDRARMAEGTPLRFGVDFLDHALRGIFPDDLILLGAPSGVGKTQLCCTIALANMEHEKKVHYIALEASEFEIERRMKYPLVANFYFSDRNRPAIDRKLNFPDWMQGRFLTPLKTYEDAAEKYFEAAYRDLFLFYKVDNFGADELIKTILSCADDTDLIILDHVHYMDFDDDNENRAMKKIAKTIRTLAIEQKKPIVAVAHLRKSDRKDEALVPGMEEFHGSSDLFKIATKIITFAPGKPTESGNYETYFRCPKNRADGGVTRFMAKELYNPREGTYERDKYQIGWADQKKSNGFEPVEGHRWPDWARKQNTGPVSSNHPADFGGQQRALRYP